MAQSGHCSTTSLLGAIAASILATSTVLASPVFLEDPTDPNFTVNPDFSFNTDLGSTFPTLLAQVDQANPGQFETSNGAVAPFSFGQSFIPIFSSLNAIEFLLGGFHSTVIVNLRDGVSGADGLSGPILAQSDVLTVEFLGSKSFLFVFPTVVSLVPGNTYVAELAVISGDLGVRHTQGNGYSAGQFLHQWFAPSNFSNVDLVFAEGLSYSVPEPSTRVLLGIGFLAAVGASLRVRKSDNCEEA